MTMIIDPFVHAWTPEDMATLAWYDASDEDTITHVAGAVSQWDDKSGNGIHVVQAVGSNQPSTGTRTLNGWNVLDGDGARFMATSGAAFAIPANEDLAICMVVVVDDINSTQDSAICGEDGAGVNRFRYRFNSNSEDSILVQSENNTNLEDVSATDISGAHLHSLIYDKTISNTLFTMLNGSVHSNVPAYSGTMSSPVRLNLFANANQSQRPDGAMAEYVLFNDTSTATIEKVEGYLAWKYGTEAKLPGGHSYALHPPGK